MFLSEWREFPSAPCLARGKKKTWWKLASRCCWNRARPWHASELVSFLVGLRTYQHSGIKPTVSLNLLTPNVNYSWRTAQLTSKVAFYIFIQQIQVPNILNMVYTLLFFSSKCSLFQNSNLFESCIIHILYTGCAKIKKIIPARKG